MKSFFKKILGKKCEKKAIVIVSGLPRSGTSMMMQMLDSGGVPVVTDHIRKADQNNPLGYYELENVKNIQEDASWLANCHGKVFKMVSALLYYLPADRRYQVIFMIRDTEEMLASQRVMLQRLGRKSDDPGDTEMAKKSEKHLQKVRDWLARQGNMDVIYIDYNEVIQDPYDNAKRVSRFLGDRLRVDKMASVVNNSLYRQRKKSV